MKKLYAVANLFITVFLIAWNYISNEVGINGNTISELSAEYFNLFTPAGYAFSIWGLIFIALLAHSIYQVKCVFDDKIDDDFVLQIGPWLIIANLANGAWLWFWLSEYTGFTVFIMLTILTSLLTIVVRLNMERWDAPKNIRHWVWLPISLYSGWIAVATIANISAYLAKIEWQPIFSETIWAVLLIVIAALVNLWMLKFRNMRAFSGVGVWAIAAIAARHWGAIPLLQWTALACVIGLVAANLLHRKTYNISNSVN